MAALIDRIEAAFVAGRANWRLHDCVDTEPLLTALAIYGHESDSNEAACMRAFKAMREKFGSDWVWMPGDVAEAICGELQILGQQQVSCGY